MRPREVEGAPPIGDASGEELSPAAILKRSRIAGFWYLLLALFSPLNLVYVPSALIVRGDAAATASAILNHEGLFRLALVGELVGQICFLFVALALYDLFKSVHKGLSRGLVILVAASVPITILNILNQFAALLLLGGSGYLASFDPGRRQNLALFFLDLKEYGVHLVGAFWGLWLLPLGLLVIRSGYFPKILGILLIVGCAGYSADFLAAFLLPGYAERLAPAIGAAESIGELPFVLWLLIRGARVSKLTAPKEGRA